MGRRVRWTVGALILVYGLLIHDRESTLWAALSLALFALPLGVQWTRWTLTRVYALWLGIALVAQSLLSPLVQSDFVTLPPNLNTTVNVTSAEIPGVRAGLRRITTDEKGFRAVPRVDYGRKRVTRIIAIGGSTTEDIMLDDRATWTHLLQESLNARGHAVEVINTGVSGLRARHHLATLRAVARYQPDFVLVLVGANDWNKHIRDQFEPVDDRYQPALLRKSALGKLLGAYAFTPLQRWLTGNSSADQHLVVDQPQGMNGDKPLESLERPIKHVFRPDAVATEYRNTMDTLSRACVELKVRCMFLTQPHAYSETAPPALRKLYWMTPPYAAYTLDLASMLQIAALYNQHTEALARREHHAFCDVAAGMDASPQLFYDDMHYTDDGAARMAALALPCVEPLLRR